MTSIPTQESTVPILKLSGVTLQRNGRVILRDVSWEIPETGQHWVLLGSNGSGKTTLLKVILGYEWPTRGQVIALGQHFGQCHLPTLRKSIGWVSAALDFFIHPQDRALDLTLSGFDATYGLYRDYTVQERQRAREALAMIGVEGLKDQTYSILSQGERQRVLIARALVHRPRLLILDEPCAGLDPAARESFLQDLGRMLNCSDAPTVLFVTHHIEEIAPWIHYALVLKEGEVFAQGRAADVITGKVLSKAFAYPCVVESDGGFYFLKRACSSIEPIP